MAVHSADVGRPNTSISASNSNAAGDEFGLVRHPSKMVSKVTMWVSIGGTGAYTSINVIIQVSNDGTNWHQLGSGAMTTALDNSGTKADSVSENIEGYQFFRANKTASVTASGSPVITATLTFGA